MDKLSSEQQAKVKKMSDLRIRSTLIHAGQDETMVSAMNREQLLEAMAVHLLSKPAEAAVAGPSGIPTGLGAEQFKMWFELEKA